jgi:hypothetical protein
MALTVTRSGMWQGLLGDLRYARVTIAFDSSYPTGGESLTAADLGLKKIDMIQIQPQSGLVFEYDYTNSKVKAYAQGVSVGAAGAATMDDFPVDAGPGASTISISLTNSGGSATHGLGALKECPNTNDLSSVTGVRVFAIGV